MGRLRQSDKLREPLHVFAMAAALVVAAILGATLGFLWNSYAKQETEQLQPPQGAETD